MVVKKIVIKVSINCQKCKTEVFKSVTKLGGIEKISMDEEKDRLTVVGVVDPVEIVKQLKKSGKFAEILSVGPNKPATKPKPNVIIFILPPYCNDCQPVAVGYPFHYGGGGGGGGGGTCSIL